MEDDESDNQIWITQSRWSKTISVGNFNMTFKMKYIDDDNDAMIGKELEIVNSSSRARISDLALA